MIKNYRQLLKDWKIFFEIYDFPVKIYSLKNYIPKNILGQITFDKVKFAYPLKPKSFIFDNLSFQIPAGKTFAICGFSGSGKTTISNLIQRFYDPNEGKILIDGVDLRDYNIEFLRRNIGFVAQEPILNSGTIEENITYGVDTYKKSDFEEVCKLSNINSFVNDKNLFPEGLKTLVGERGTKVSGGQKQRIAIARALMKNSKILIFDEATSALDAESEAQVQSAIDNVVKKRGITIIIIAHRLSTIIKADCIAVINNGKIVEMGKHEELLKKDGEYKKLFQKQLVLNSGKENK
jgi:ATP-binding cassette subfamily B (MDR/TAP) protein 1